MNSVLVITIIGILLIAASVVLIAMVLMQSAKNSRMSGVVSGGGAETFFGKYKGKTIDKKLNRLTVVVSLVFVAIVILLYIIQPGTGRIDINDPDWDQAQSDMTATTSDTTTEAPTTTKAPTTTQAPTTTGSPDVTDPTAAEDGDETPDAED